MDWATWAPTMTAIRAEFGYAEADDRAAAHELRARLPAGAPPWRDLGVDIRNRRNLVIVGAGPSLAAAPASLFVGQVTVAADGATGRLRELGVVPHAVVTDLDGHPDALAWAAAQGSRMVVHAHGDNRPALAALVPRLGPLVHGTHQVAPEPALEPLRNVGGFTDGDRAVMLCEELGARVGILVGFDFDAPPSAYSHKWDPRTKPAKLAWAKRIVEGVHGRGKLHLRQWVPPAR
ncbi:MAG: 6-hydroxymethylpterin diphosphokinase MptE-like protein [Candidatus Thermoplasmatota archaeon]